MPEPDQKPAEALDYASRPAEPRRRAPGRHSAAGCLLAAGVLLGGATLIVGCVGVVLAGGGHGDYTVFNTAEAMGVLTAILFAGALIAFIASFGGKG